MQESFCKEMLCAFGMLQFKFHILAQQYSDAVQCGHARCGKQGVKLHNMMINDCEHLDEGFGCSDCGGTPGGVWVYQELMLYTFLSDGRDTVPPETGKISTYWYLCKFFGDSYKNYRTF